MARVRLSDFMCCLLAELYHNTSILLLIKQKDCAQIVLCLLQRKFFMQCMYRCVGWITGQVINVFLENMVIGDLYAKLCRTNNKRAIITKCNWFVHVINRRHFLGDKLFSVITLSFLPSNDCSFPQIVLRYLLQFSISKRFSNLPYCIFSRLRANGTSLLIAEGTDPTFTFLNPASVFFFFLRDEPRLVFSSACQQTCSFWCALRYDINIHVHGHCSPATVNITQISVLFVSNC